MLPDKLSDLVEVAIKDLEAVERNPEYTVNMSDWCYKTTGTCYVCLAGAVMVQTLGAKPERDGAEVIPGDFDTDTRDKLCALNEIREGDVYCALSAMGQYKYGDPEAREVIKQKITVEIPPYKTNPTKFKAAMREVAAQLKEIGY